MRRLPALSLALALAVLGGAGPALARRAPPPAVIPTEETQKARDLYKTGRYGDAVAAAKAALNKNERYTPAMLVMAKSYYKLHKYEWMKKLWEMMQANGASSAEKAEIYQLLAFLEVDAKNVPGAIQLFKQAAEAKPDDAILWNNLGAQYLAAKNYADAAPVLERSSGITALARQAPLAYPSKSSPGCTAWSMPVRSTPALGATAGADAGAWATGGVDSGLQAPQAQTTARNKADRSMCIGITGRKPAATIARGRANARCRKSPRAHEKARLAAGFIDSTERGRLT